MVRFLPLIWSGIWRKPGRAILIFLQVCVAFALFGVLQGLKTGVEQLVRAARADVLLVHGSLSLIDSLPLSLLEQIKSVPGVEAVVPVELFGGIYQNPSQKLGIVAIRPDPGWLAAFTFTIAPEYAEALRRTRTGAIVMEGLVKRYGWKIGDHIPLKSATVQTNGSTDWAFDVVGTYTDSDVGGGRDNILINYDYYDEARAAGRGRPARGRMSSGTRSTSSKSAGPCFQPPCSSHSSPWSEVKMTVARSRSAASSPFQSSPIFESA